MKRIISRLEIKDGIHLMGIGIITSVLPMQQKIIDLKMYYDTTYPSMVIIEAKGLTHFISLDTVKCGTFDDTEVDGNVVE
jgi:hypothetical protein